MKKHFLLVLLALPLLAFAKSTVPHSSTCNSLSNPHMQKACMYYDTANAKLDETKDYLFKTKQPIIEIQQLLKKKRPLSQHEKARIHTILNQVVLNQNKALESLDSADKNFQLQAKLHQKAMDNYNLVQKK